MDPILEPSFPRSVVPDSALVRRMADRDATALIELQRRYRGSVYARVYSILWDTERAELVVTRAFEQLWHAAVRMNGGQRALSWLQRTAAELAHAERTNRRR
jgi:DNA-directed RNA polymerase specialized sigma24 family protein